MPCKTETAIGVDVGGTRIRVARISRDGEILERVIEPVHQDRQGFADQILRLIGGMRGDDTVGVGVGIPGRVEGAAGAIRSAGYLDIAGLDLQDLILRATGLQTRVENDATLALVAEAHARPDGATGVIAMFTIGTGIGGALLQNGAPWHGGGISGQFGHMVVAADGPPCNCGRIGCVETFSSGTALGRLCTEAGLPKGLRAEALLDLADTDHHPAASAILASWARPLRRAIDTLVAVVDPNKIIIGGGLGGEMVRALARLPATDKWFGLPVEAAQLGDSAGVIGAGLCGLTAGPPRRQDIGA